MEMCFKIQYEKLEVVKERKRERETVLKEALHGFCISGTSSGKPVFRRQKDEQRFAINGSNGITGEE